MPTPATIARLGRCAFASIVLAAGAARGDCPPYVMHHPGSDYTNGDQRQGLAVVEQYHFTADVEKLVRGRSGPLADDIGYTLEHFPNHHRALASMARLALREKVAKPRYARYSVTCYFDRAIGFRPEDARLRSIYGSYLLASGQQDAALIQMREAARLAPDNPAIHYNLGLIYMKSRQYALALAHAHVAYGAGFPLPGLKKQLLAAHAWQPPVQAINGPADEPAGTPGAAPSERPADQ